MRVRALVSTMVVVAAVATTRAPLRAQEAPPDAEKTEALALFERGKDAYKAGRFTESAALLESAYARFPEPVLLYNLARAYEGAAELAKAIVAYERYLAEATDVADRPAIEQRVANLKQNEAEKKRLEEERDAAKRAEVASRRPAEAPPSSSPSPVPWVVAGVGVVGLGAGAVLGAVALSKNDGRTQVEYVDQRPAAEDLALGATIAFIAGGIVTAGGVVWGIVDVVSSSGGSGAPTDASAALRLGPGGAALVGTF